MKIPATLIYTILFAVLVASQAASAYPARSESKSIPDIFLANQFYVVDFMLPSEPGLKLGSVHYSIGFGLYETRPNSGFGVSLCLVNASDDTITDSDIITCQHNLASGSGNPSSQFVNQLTYNRALVFLYFTTSGDNLPYYMYGRSATLTMNFVERDTDGDGLHDGIDPDDDNDGVEDHEDTFPKDPNESVDTDGDGVGNNADADDDGDGYEDVVDRFPLDPQEWLDNDNDGVGDNADFDDDNDGMPDEIELTRGRNPMVNEAAVLLIINQLLLD